jgi:hypothetical protein
LIDLRRARNLLVAARSAPAAANMSSLGNIHIRVAARTKFET